LGGTRGGAIFLIARSSASSVFPASTCLAVSMNRSNCGFSSDGFGLRAGSAPLHLPTSRSIGKPRSDDAFQGAIGALFIVNAETDAVAVSEIEFSYIPMKVAFAAVLVDALHASLEHAVEALDAIGVDIAAHILPALC